MVKPTLIEQLRQFYDPQAVFLDSLNPNQTSTKKTSLNNRKNKVLSESPKHLTRGRRASVQNSLLDMNKLYSFENDDIADKLTEGGISEKKVDKSTESSLKAPSLSRRSSLAGIDKKSQRRMSIASIPTKSATSSRASSRSSRRRSSVVGDVEKKTQENDVPDQGRMQIKQRRMSLSVFTDEKTPSPASKRVTKSRRSSVISRRSSVRRSLSSSANGTVKNISLLDEIKQALESRTMTSIEQIGKDTGDAGNDGNDGNAVEPSLSEKESDAKVQGYLNLISNQTSSTRVLSATLVATKDSTVDRKAEVNPVSRGRRSRRASVSFEPSLYRQRSVSAPIENSSSNKENTDKLITMNAVNDFDSQNAMSSTKPLSRQATRRNLSETSRELRLAKIQSKGFMRSAHLKDSFAASKPALSLARSKTRKKILTNEERERRKQEKEFQQDALLFTSSNLLMRESLRFDRQILAIIHELWRVVDANGDGQIQRGRINVTFFFFCNFLLILS